MELYAGIDLHSNNSMVVVLDETDRVVGPRACPIISMASFSALRSCAGQIQGVAVESTFNWYWLVDGLREAGYVVHLVNTAAVKQYDGLKYSGDAADARHLAHLLRLGILPEGYIYPREARAVRDLLRKRSQLVRQRTTQILSIQNLLARNLSLAAPGNLIKGCRRRTSMRWRCCRAGSFAVQANLAVMHCLDEQIHGSNTPFSSAPRCARTTARCRR